MKRLLPVAAAAVTLALSAPAHAGTITVSRAWSRATAAPGAVGVGFMTITNAGAADALAAARCPAAESVMLDRTTTGTMMMNGAPMQTDRMAQVPTIPVPAGGQLVLKPGGWHIMPSGLKNALAPGGTLSCTLHFAHAGDVPVTFQVQGPGDTDYAAQR